MNYPNFFLFIISDENLDISQSKAIHISSLLKKKHRFSSVITFKSFHRLPETCIGQRKQDVLDKGNPVVHGIGIFAGPPVPGILQARTLEWVAISFSNA